MCFPTYKPNRDCKRECIKNVSTYNHMTVKYVNVWDVFPQKEENTLVYPHEKIKNRRERDGVTTSQTNCICKRVFVKMCFFVFHKNCEGLFQNLPKQKTKRCCWIHVHDKHACPCMDHCQRQHGHVFTIICSHFEVKSHRKDTQWKHNTAGQAQMRNWKT